MHAFSLYYWDRWSELFINSIHDVGIHTDNLRRSYMLSHWMSITIEIFPRIRKDLGARLPNLELEHSSHTGRFVCKDIRNKLWVMGWIGVFKIRPNSVRVHFWLGQAPHFSYLTRKIQYCQRQLCFRILFHLNWMVELTSMWTMVYELWSHILCAKLLIRSN